MSLSPEFVILRPYMHTKIESKLNWLPLPLPLKAQNTTSGLVSIKSWNESLNSDFLPYLKSQIRNSSNICTGEGGYKTNHYEKKFFLKYTERSKNFRVENLRAKNFRVIGLIAVIPAQFFLSDWSHSHTWFRSYSHTCFRSYNHPPCIVINW